MTIKTFEKELKERLENCKKYDNDKRYVTIFAEMLLVAKTGDIKKIEERIRIKKLKQMQVWQNETITDIVEYKIFCQPLMTVENLFKKVK